MTNNTHTLQMTVEDLNNVARKVVEGLEKEKKDKEAQEFIKNYQVLIEGIRKSLVPSFTIWKTSKKKKYFNSKEAI